jgi:structural maintenance of chromosome 2
LFNLVVDTDVTGKLLLQHGELKRKITIIPMNQIRPRVIDSNVVRIAKDLVGSENVFTALSLIDFDPKYKQVLEFVFGSRLVCTTLDAAKQVAFHRQILVNTITLEGDHFDPEGTLTGGSRQERASVLLKLNELQNDNKVLETKRVELGNLQVKLENVKNVSIKYNGMKREFDKEFNQLNVAKSNLEQNAHHQKLEKYNSLLAEIGRVC